MTFKLKKVLANIFYVTTALFFILFALDAPQKQNHGFQSDVAQVSQSEDVAGLTEFLTTTNYN